MHASSSCNAQSVTRLQRCLKPLSPKKRRKRDLSLFWNIVDTGAFIQWALILIPLGLIALVLSFFVPADVDTF
jgi:hypothetical protein